MTSNTEVGGRPPSRTIHRLLVANRGEIATRIVNTARELPSPVEIYTLYTEDDTLHTINSTHAVALRAPSSYLSIDELVEIVRRHNIDAIHPGYGFLSESVEFAKRMWNEAGAAVIGPGWEILQVTGDKVSARRLAKECGVPILPGTLQPLQDVEEVRTWMKSEKVELPIMVKASDGGGGRGIRLIRDEDSLPNLIKRAREESPTKQVFVESAAVDGFRHVEVQIIGDGTGGVTHLWERECSIQRRYQKIVEMAPSTLKREFAQRIIDSAVKMAESVNYFSLGTFEFLAKPESEEYYFLEVNPRLQVEHTITESVSLLDIVRLQLELSQGATLKSLAPFMRSVKAYDQPPLFSLQLRLTAENVQSDWSLSIGKITSFHLPSGNGIRVDTALVGGHPTTISADFDSLFAKIIVTAQSWEEVVLKTKRALNDTSINGVKTNLDILRAIVNSKDFVDGACDTQWLEQSMSSLLESGQELSKSVDSRLLGSKTESSNQGASQGLTSSTVLLRKGDAWSIKLTPAERSDSSIKTSGEPSRAVSHHLKLDKVLRNEFPTKLLAEIEYTSSSENAQPFYMEMNATSASVSALMSEGKHRKGDPNNPLHVVIPFPGKLVEFVCDEGDVVKSGDTICVVQQMKMELEVRAARGGRVKWVTEAEDGEDVAEGTLAAELEEVSDERSEARARL